MPRLPDVDKATYVCPKCSQAVQRTKADFETPTLKRMFKGRLPAYLVCGRCFSKHPSKAASHMWRTDVPSSDRQASLWGHYGSSAQALSKALEGVYQRITDVSFAKCKRFVAYPITDRVIKDTRELLQAAESELQDVKHTKGKLNAVAIHFSTSKAKALRGQHYAVIDWAPNGIWGYANTVKTGDYKQHQFKIVRHHQTKKQG